VECYEALPVRALPSSKTSFDDPFRFQITPFRRVTGFLPRGWLSAGCALALSAAASADYKDDIGYNQLELELGAAMFTGSGVTVSQVEAAENSNYAPDTANPELTGKTFALRSGVSGASGHATAVAQHFYGTSTSLAPAITTIDLYEAEEWLRGGMLNYEAIGSNSPKAETRDVANFSWIGTTGSAANDQEIIRRFDYTIQQSNYVAVVGTNNGDSSSVPQLLAHTYNGITVGKSDGQHASGMTTFDTPGRIKPDIVAPPSSAGANFTSFTTPLVSGAAAGLIETARGKAALANGADSRSVKALLLAGATKTEFPNWSRTSTSPLDTTYGAGELNLYNSYHILAAGEQSPSASGTVGTQGWDFGTVSTSNLLYYFEVPAGMTLDQFSAALTWNRLVTDALIGPAFLPEATIDNLNLKLFSATSFTLGPLLDSSVSSVDNVEYIFQLSLAPGRYALEVEHGTLSTGFALAWTGTLAVPEISSGWLMLAGLGLLGSYRNRVARA
jgi:hypothetical protein